jgi:hypothetical protein
MVRIRRGKKARHYTENKIDFGPDSSFGKLREMNMEALKILREAEHNYGFIKRIYWKLWKRRNP